LAARRNSDRAPRVVGDSLRPPIFQVTEANVASWGKRLDEQGPKALLQIPQPVNRFPHFVRACVQRLRALCPFLGKAKVAQILARAGLHLAVTSVGRIRREALVEPPTPPRPRTMPSVRRVTAKYPNHVWHVDFTVVPTAAGFWTHWLPFARPQCWPFCWWLALAIDHFSRKALGFAVFQKQPTAPQVRQFLRRVTANLGAKPKYIVTDSGGQFTSASFGDWCQQHGISHRTGAVGQTGSIALVDVESVHSRTVVRPC
jgi:transposase InsO family protein